MAELSQYSLFQEMEKYFTCKTIDNIDQFEELYSNNDIGSIWRRSIEAKHKIYSSLQRHWIKNDFKDDINEIKKYLKSNIEFAIKWNGGVLKRSLEKPI